MDKMLEIQPIFIALTGARDRARHEGSPVGCTAGHFKLEMRLGVISDKLTDDLQAQVEQLERNAMRVVEYTLQTMANDISRLVSGQDTPASINLKPDCLTAVMPEDEPFMRVCQQAFFDTCSTDDEAMSALSGVTKVIVQHWAR